MTTPLPVGKYIAGGEEFGKRLAKVERWVKRWCSRICVTGGRYVRAI